MKRTKPKGIINWLFLEGRIRAAFEQLKQDNNGYSESDCLLEISEAIGDETGRGYPLETERSSALSPAGKS